MTSYVLRLLYLHKPTSPFLHLVFGVLMEKVKTFLLLLSAFCYFFSLLGFWFHFFNLLDFWKYMSLMIIIVIIT